MSNDKWEYISDYDESDIELINEIELNEYYFDDLNKKKSEKNSEKKSEKNFEKKSEKNFEKKSEKNLKKKSEKNSDEKIILHLNKSESIINFIMNNPTPYDIEYMNYLYDM